MSRLLDQKVAGRWPFHYRKAAETDLRLTFRRERERIKAEAERRAPVVQIKKAAK